MQFIPNLVGSTTIPPGSINLAAYPGLTYAPAQHGEGIRFAHNGEPVDGVATQQAGAVAMSAILDVANAIGVPFGDVCDALKYLRDQKRI